jgi:demethylmenaquinone methyltransferase/2-methoxy-6-polyprenyl-1,4-benzoquinol methylase
MSGKSKKDQVKGMFNAIAHRYDFLNHFLSLGIDYYWRRKAIKILSPANGAKVLDVATGTADVAIMAARQYPQIHVTGVDISEEMLARGLTKVARKKLTHRINLQIADSEQLDFENDRFDGVIVAFGVRNFENLEKGLAEMYRVVKPGGRVVILEFSQPATSPFRQIYHFYFNHILPRIGRLVSKNPTAYTYLPNSVLAFPYGQEFLKILERVGFRQCYYKPLTFGIATIYTGVK